MCPAREFGLYPAGRGLNVGLGKWQCKDSKPYGYLVWPSDLNIFPVGSMDYSCIRFCFDVNVLAKVNLETLK